MSFVAASPVAAKPQAAPRSGPGTLDPSFGDQGWAVASFGARTLGSAMAVQRNGDVVVVGTVTNRGTPSFALARFRLDGALDTTFGGDGRVTTAFTPNGGQAYAVAIDGHGRIVVAGRKHEQKAQLYDFVLARYRPDGSLDHSFGSGGKVTTGFGKDDGTATAVAIQHDGRIVVGGLLDTTGDVSERWELARYLPNGSLDPSFGDHGKVQTIFPVHTAEGYEFLSAIVVQPNGRILAGGDFFDGQACEGRAALARYLPDGTLDPSFGTKGTILTAFGGRNDSIVIALARAGKGDLVAAGRTASLGCGGEPPPEHPQFVVARYKPDGTLAPHFGAKGVVITGFHKPLKDVFNATFTGVAVQKDGKVVAAGWESDSSQPATVGSAMVLARLLPSGQLDPAFGQDGKVVAEYPAGQEAMAEGVGLEPSGRIVAGGTVRPDKPDEYSVVVARFLG